VELVAAEVVGSEDVEAMLAEQVNDRRLQPACEEICAARMRDYGSSVEKGARVVEIARGRGKEKGFHPTGIALIGATVWIGTGGKERPDDIRILIPRCRGSEG
jgi:hypothetical protein